jgi:hypothetical protein
MGWGCSSVVELLPSMCEVLLSTPSTMKKKKKKEFWWWLHNNENVLMINFRSYIYFTTIKTSQANFFFFFGDTRV